MFCNNCQHTIDDDSIFCENCGIKLFTPIQPPVSPVNPAGIKNKKLVVGLTLTCICAAILLVLFFGSNLFNSNGINQENEQETKANEFPAISQMEETKLAPGELLFKGNAYFSQAQSCEVSFVLTADKSQIRNLKIELTGLKITHQHLNSLFTINVGSIIHQSFLPFPVINTKVDASLQNAYNLSFSFSGNDNASGFIDYTYIITDGEGVNRTEIPINFGRCSISFRVSN